jgi:hypothetical protein
MKVTSAKSRSAAFSCTLVILGQRAQLTMDLASQPRLLGGILCSM